MRDRLLTLLINDKRNGEDQIAEVTVPLRPCYDQSIAYWADAADVCRQLQAGASRIDGKFMFPGLSRCGWLSSA